MTSTTTRRRPLASTREVAEYLGKPPKTLAEWRSRRIGPRYIKVGRDVRYLWVDVDAWVQSKAEPTG